MVKRKWAAFIIVALCTMLLLTACNNGGGSKPRGEEYTYTVLVRNADFTFAVSVNLIYEGKQIATTDENGFASIKVADHVADEAKKKLSVSGKNCIALPVSVEEYGSLHANIRLILCDDTDIANGFYFVSGKIVKHIGGESVEPGVVLSVDGKPVYNSNDGRDFSYILVRVGCTITASKVGFEFVDNSGIAYNNIILTAEQINITSETQPVHINGAVVQLKSIGGITFRARAVRTE